MLYRTSRCAVHGCSTHFAPKRVGYRLLKKQGLSCFFLYCTTTTIKPEVWLVLRYVFGRRRQSRSAVESTSRSLRWSPASMAFCAAMLCLKYKKNRRFLSRMAGRRRNEATWSLPACCRFPLLSPRWPHLVAAPHLFFFHTQQNLRFNPVTDLKKKCLRRPSGLNTR